MNKRIEVTVQRDGSHVCPPGRAVQARNLRMDLTAEEAVAVAPALLGFADLDQDPVDRPLQAFAEGLKV